MNSRVFFLLVLFFATGSAGAQTFEYLEDFENGDADWVDFDRNAVTYHATGGHDGGAYISTTRDIVTQPSNPFGSGLIQFRCAIAPSQLPTQDCSNEIFVGDYIAMPVTELRFWFRHDSVQNQQVFIRIPTPANTPGASAFIDAPIPPNTWTEMTLEINPTNPEWESQFGGSTYNNILSNVGRLQPGVYYGIGVDYTETDVTFDIDDVRITGTGLDAPIRITSPGFPDTLHPHHDGTMLSNGTLPDDTVAVWVYGQSTGAGDAIDLDASTIDVATLRFGPGQTAVDSGASQETGGIDLDSDGIDDSRYRFLISESEIQCSDTDATIDGRLTTGEVFVGVDAFTSNCNAQCHN